MFVRTLLFVFKSGRSTRVKHQGSLSCPCLVHYFCGHNLATWLCLNTHALKLFQSDSMHSFLWGEWWGGESTTGWEVLYRNQ